MRVILDFPLSEIIDCVFVLLFFVYLFVSPRKCGIHYIGGDSALSAGRGFVRDASRT